jgi:hypothetical protein
MINLILVSILLKMVDSKIHQQTIVDQSFQIYHHGNKMEIESKLVEVQFITKIGRLGKYVNLIQILM